MRDISIRFTPAQRQTHMAVLLEMPHRLAAPLIAHINAQIQAQQVQAAQLADKQA